MASFFVSLLGGAYCLVEHDSLDSLDVELQEARHTGASSWYLTRPDGKSLVLDPRTVTLIQPPAPASFKHTDTKEN
jgi:hypothetical protein